LWRMNLSSNGRVRTRNKLSSLIALLSFLSLGCSREPLNLSWKDTSDNEDGFRIYRITSEGKTKVAEVGANVTTYTDKQPGRNACYAVTAFNAAGESPVSEVKCPGESAIVRRQP
jgi:fibronectin type 3 domain-containing protein